MARPSPQKPSTRKSQSSRSNRFVCLRGVRVHNLQNVDVDIPRGALVAICGVSGSGKTSLAIDTLYAEGQRRYIESFSAYTRQFLQRLDKPDFDRIDGLPPALAVTRGGASRSNRSTVGTASETLDYLRLLFSKIAKLTCYECGQPVEPASPQSAAELIRTMLGGAKLMVTFSASWADVAERATVLADLQSQGLLRFIAGERTVHLGDRDRESWSDLLPREGSIQVIVDRLRGGEGPERSVESLETAFSLGQGNVRLLVENNKAIDTQINRSTAIPSFCGTNMEQDSTSPSNDSAERRNIVDGSHWTPIDLTTQLRCTTCGIDFQPPTPRLFSFNSPLGACPKCEGFGETVDLDMDLIVPDRSVSIRQGAIAPWNNPSSRPWLETLLDRAEELGIPVDVPFRKLTARQVRLVLEGDAKFGFGGLAEFFAFLERKKYKMHVRVFLSRWRSYHTCDQCQGARLKPDALAYSVNGRNISQWCEATIDRLLTLIDGLNPSSNTIWSESQQRIAHVPLEQLSARLKYLQQVGLGYLTLDRTLRTLSSGEAQRTALTAALGSSLVNMLYVLDEPSVGLHPHNVETLATSIQALSQRGNMVVMIEHEEALINRADWLIEVGPGAGSAGGQIIYSGPRDKLPEDSTLTGGYLSGKREVPKPASPRLPSAWLKLTGCRGNNLKNIDVDFPLGVLCLVTGVSGSGKSSLVHDTLYGAVANRLTKNRHTALLYDSLLGLGHLDECMMVDQSPVSRSPRSNPVTYVKAFDEIRRVFAETQDARLRGLTTGHFSFNSDLGRCRRCEGDGVLQIDMQFLADVFMTCPDCKGSRYRNEILSVRYRDHSIADVLKMTVRDAQHFFRGHEKVQQKLAVLTSVGLDYLELGQSASTLSSGEGQRLKLAGFLGGASRKRTLFLMDEPSTGLHTHDIVQLLDCFDALLAAGHSLIIVEHNLHLMAAADYIIDLGPGAAEEGGRVVATGTPDQIAMVPDSITGRFLKPQLV